MSFDVEGHKHPPGVVEEATENTATVQALVDNLIERGLDPQVCRLFIVDGAKTLTKAIRKTFGADIPIQRCQVHKARNITDRIDPKLHAWVRHALKQAWKLDDADKAERLPRNLARRLELEAPSVSRAILEGLDEILTVITSWHPAPVATVAGVDEYHRVDECRDPSDLPECEAMAGCPDGAALDRRRNVRSRQGLPPSQGLQAVARPEGRARKAPRPTGPCAC